MITSNPISTISYNSMEYLTKVLNQLIEQRIINFYSWIYHYAEGLDHKNHIHLFVIPNGRVNTDTQLSEVFFEYVDENSLPLKCLPFYKSQWTDWFLYSCHDERYLAQKCEYREFHYSMQDFHNSDDTFFNDLIFKMDLFKFRNLERFEAAIKDGKSFSWCVANHMVPIPLIHQYRDYYDFIIREYSGTVSGGNKGGSLVPPITPNS